jgi:signal transduction histidine kinase
MNDLLTRIMGAVASLPKTETNHIAQAEEALLEAREVNRRLQHLTLASDGLKKEVKLQPIFDQVVNTAGAASVAKLEIAVQPNTGSVVCDPAELLQVLSNLVRNATEAMTPPPHNPTIQLTSELVHLSAGEIPSLAEGNYVKAEVRDNGCGISGDIIDKIWEPFLRRKNTPQC